VKISTKTKVLEFRRANFSSLRVQLGGVPRGASMEDKGASECRDFFRNALLEAQEQFIAFQGKGSRRSKRPPFDLTVSFSVCSKPKKKCTRGGKADEYPLRTTRALPGHAEMQLEKQKLSPN